MLETLAGKQRANVVASILNNMTTAEKALQTMENPDITAMEELDKITGSLEGRMVQVGASFEKLSNSFMSNSGLKTIVSSFDKILQLAIKLTDKIGGLGTAIEAFFAFRALRGNGALNMKSSMLTGSGMELFLGSNTPIMATINNMREATSARGALNALFSQPLISDTDMVALQRYNDLVKANVSQEQAFAKTKVNMSRNAQNIVINTKAQADALAAQTKETVPAIVSMEQLTTATMRQTVAQKALSIATNFVGKALNMGLSMGTTIIIMKIINDIVSLINKEKELIKQAKEAAEEFKKQEKTLQDLKEKYVEIITSITDETEKTKALDEWKQTLIETYGEEANALKGINDVRQNGIDLIKQEELAQKEKFLAENKEGIEAATKYVETPVMRNLKSQGLMNNFFGGKDDTQAYNQLITEFAENSENMIDFSEKLKAKRKELSNKVTTNSASEEERNFFDYIDKDIKGIEEKLVGEGLAEIYNQAIEASMGIIAEKVKDNEGYLEIFRKTYNNMGDIVRDINEGQDYNTEDLKRIADSTGVSLEDMLEAYKVFEGFTNLSSKHVLLFSDSLKELNKTISFLPDSTTEFLSKLIELQNELDGAQNSLVVLKTSIGEARDSLEDIDALIDKQRDVDAFFNATEMSEALDKYPELQDNILECAYGYKFEEGALEELKTAKAQEKQLALQATLDEQTAVYNSVKEKMNSYSTELSGIKTLTEAKIKMAELEQQLANNTSKSMLSMPQNGSIFALGNNMINTLKTATQNKKAQEEKDILQHYIDIQESMEKTMNSLMVSQTQIDMLGKTFEDIDKETEKIKNNAEKTKKATQDTIDDMEKAKDAIEDLLDLTVEMIKKQKELEKEALEEQLDGFKEVIKRKKEQLSLEKEIHDFQKDVKEKNTAVSDIQQDLDTLSLDNSLEAKAKKKDLEAELAKEKANLDDFLYEHEVETRQNALDEEERLFEENIDAKTKAIEDYLKKEGIIRQQAMDLINGQTQQFYNDLQEYATTYSKYTQTEFVNLWNKAYEYLNKYNNGQINVCYTMNYLTGQIEYLTNYIENLEREADSATQALKDLAGTAYDMSKLTTELHNVADAANTINGISFPHNPALNPNNHSYPSSATTSAYHSYWKTPDLSAMTKFHDGGVVTGGIPTSPGSSEVICKLLKREIVLTPNMQDNLINKVIPGAINYGASLKNDSPSSVNIVQGDINISGNADESTIQKIKGLLKQQSEEIFGKINNSNRRLGGTPNTVGL